MIEDLIGIYTDTTTLIPDQILICVLFAVLLGVILCISYIISVDKEKRSLPFMTTLIILPAIVTLVIILIGSNLARAVSLGGVFALVRFRSAQGNGRDISFVFLAMASGLSVALGMLTVGLLATVLLAVIIIVVSKVGVIFLDPKVDQLRVLIPEDMDYQGAFDDLFKEYTNSHKLMKVKTTNMGTLFELTYRVKLKNNADQKKFMDELRKRNGNLTITLAEEKEKEGDL